MYSHETERNTLSLFKSHVCPSNANFDRVNTEGEHAVSQEIKFYVLPALLNFTHRATGSYHSAGQYS